MTEVIYTAAHGGFARESVPLGGGAAVCDHLVDEWSRTRPFALRLITPSILGPAAPTGKQLVRFGEREYARFCDAFERVATEEILRHDPQRAVVLSNDVSEGPDFGALAARGFRVFTIYHVDVVAYVAAIYGRGWIRPETTVRWHRRLRNILPLPQITRLVWDKQESSVRHSSGLIVPSEGMRDVMLRCYPDCPAERIHVLPWGSWDIPSEVDPLAAERLRQEFAIPSDAQILLTLSRISPEKGQDLLLRALLDWERRDDFPSSPLWVFICGEPAFMQGEKFLEKLKTLAARLRRTRVIFPGFVTGERKRAFFALADLYIFPSRHESYGLTLIEALAAGVPAITLDHHGARSVMREEFGMLVQPSELQNALEKLLKNAKIRQKMSENARFFAQKQRFSHCAAELARILAI